MKTYIEIIIPELTAGKMDLLTALLDEIGFTGFEQRGKSLAAFIDKENLDANALENVAKEQDFEFSTTEIQEENWNAVWESNFDPIRVANFVGIRADFHEPMPDVVHEILITPKMSFGTGHHATTYMMVQQMEALDWKGKSVFDFGTGTGILAILAEKLGAAHIHAVDNDAWSIENAAENFAKNNTQRVELNLADTPDITKNYDIILANINKNIILAYIETLTSLLPKGGLLMLSGLLETDEIDIIAETERLQLNLLRKESKDQWISLLFTK